MKVKGSAIAATIKFAKERFGDNARDIIMENLSEEERQSIAFEVCNALWYPFDFYIHITDIVVNVLGDGDENLLREIGAASARMDDKVIPKMFYKLGTPSFIVRLGTWAFQRYFDEGKVKTIGSGKGFVGFEISGLSMIHKYHYLRVAGWMQQALELGGGKNAISEPQVIERDGEQILVFMNRWE